MRKRQGMHMLPCPFVKRKIQGDFYFLLACIFLLVTVHLSLEQDFHLVQKGRPAAAAGTHLIIEVIAVAYFNIKNAGNIFSQVFYFYLPVIKAVCLVGAVDVFHQVNQVSGPLYGRLASLMGIFDLPTGNLILNQYPFQSYIQQSRSLCGVYSCRIIFFPGVCRRTEVRVWYNSA